MSDLILRRGKKGILKYKLMKLMIKIMIKIHEDGMEDYLKIDYQPLNSQQHK